MAYTGNIIAQPGDNAAAVALTDDCFDLSDNFIEVNRVVALTGNIAAPKTGPSLGLSAVSDLSLAPNPAVDQLNLRFTVAPTVDELATLVIYNLNGQVMHREPYPHTAGQHQTELDVSQLVDGLYFLMIESESFQQRERFVKTY